ETRFGLDPVFVSIGVDLLRFRPRGLPRDPRLLLTQARTWSGGGEAGARLKGWDTARETIHLLRRGFQTRPQQGAPHMKLATFSLEDKPIFPAGLIHQHIQSPSDDRLAELYSQAGLYLLTSNHEGFGLTAAEAMACGCPVVATRADGNEEFCIHGETALTADPGDIERLTRHCLRIQREPDLAEELSRRGLRMIREDTWERVIDRLEVEFVREKPPADLPDDPPMRTADIMQRSPEELRRIVPLADVEYSNLALEAPPDCDFTVVIPTVGAAE